MRISGILILVIVLVSSVAAMMRGSNSWGFRKLGRNTRGKPNVHGQSEGTPVDNSGSNDGSIEPNQHLSSSSSQPGAQVHSAPSEIKGKSTSNRYRSRKNLQQETDNSKTEVPDHGAPVDNSESSSFDDKASGNAVTEATTKFPQGFQSVIATQPDLDLRVSEESVETPILSSNDLTQIPQSFIFTGDNVSQIQSDPEDLVSIAGTEVRSTKSGKVKRVFINSGGASFTYTGKCRFLVDKNLFACFATDAKPMNADIVSQAHHYTVQSDTMRLKISSEEEELDLVYPSEEETLRTKFGKLQIIFQQGKARISVLADYAVTYDNQLDQPLTFQYADVPVDEYYNTKSIESMDVVTYKTNDLRPNLYYLHVFYAYNVLISVMHGLNRAEFHILDKTADWSELGTGKSERVISNFNITSVEQEVVILDTFKVVSVLKNESLHFKFVPVYKVNAFEVPYSIVLGESLQVSWGKTPQFVAYSGFLYIEDVKVSDLLSIDSVLEASVPLRNPQIRHGKHKAYLKSNGGYNMSDIKEIEVVVYQNLVLESLEYPVLSVSLEAPFGSKAFFFEVGKREATIKWDNAFREEVIKYKHNDEWVLQTVNSSSSFQLPLEVGEYSLVIGNWEEMSYGTIVIYRPFVAFRTKLDRYKIGENVEFEWDLEKRSNAPYLDSTMLITVIDGGRTFVKNCSLRDGSLLFPSMELSLGTHTAKASVNDFSFSITFSLNERDLPSPEHDNILLFSDEVVYFAKEQGEKIEFRMNEYSRSFEFSDALRFNTSELGRAGRYEVYSTSVIERHIEAIVIEPEIKPSEILCNISVIVGDQLEFSWEYPAVIHEFIPMHFQVRNETTIISKEIDIISRKFTFKVEELAIGDYKVFFKRDFGELNAFEVYGGDFKVMKPTLDLNLPSVIEMSSHKAEITWTAQLGTETKRNLEIAAYLRNETDTYPFFNALVNDRRTEIVGKSLMLLNGVYQVLYELGSSNNGSSLDSLVFFGNVSLVLPPVKLIGHEQVVQWHDFLVIKWEFEGCDGVNAVHSTINISDIVSIKVDLCAQKHTFKLIEFQSALQEETPYELYVGGTRSDLHVQVRVDRTWIYILAGSIVAAAFIVTVTVLIVRRRMKLKKLKLEQAFVFHNNPLFESNL